RSSASDISKRCSWGRIDADTCLKNRVLLLSIFPGHAVKQKIRTILDDLENARENLLSLSDDMTIYLRQDRDAET
ncbi:MAG: hypothetical protein ACOC0A_03375, partial [Planctomycetota bacterium]